VLPSLLCTRGADLIPITELAVSPSLVQSLKTNTTGVREVSSKVLDIVVWPFRYTDSLVLSDSEDEDDVSDGHGEEEERSKGPLVDRDELPIAEKQAVSMRLLALVRREVEMASPPPRADSFSSLACTSNDCWATRFELAAPRNDAQDEGTVLAHLLFVHRGTLHSLSDSQHSY